MLLKVELLEWLVKDAESKMTNSPELCRRCKVLVMNLMRIPGGGFISSLPSWSYVPKLPMTAV